MTPTSSKPAGTSGAPLVTRSVIDEVDVDLDTVAGTGGTHNRADALRSATAAANHPTEIARTHFYLQLDATLRRKSLDAHGIGIVNDGSNDMREHCGGRWSGQFVTDIGSVVSTVVRIAHLAARAAPNSVHAPEISSSLRTRSLG